MAEILRFPVERRLSYTSDVEKTNYALEVFNRSGLTNTLSWIGAELSDAGWETAPYLQIGTNNRELLQKEASFAALPDVPVTWKELPSGLSIKELLLIGQAPFLSINEGGEETTNMIQEYIGGEVIKGTSFRLLHEVRVGHPEAPIVNRTYHYPYFSRLDWDGTTHVEQKLWELLDTRPALLP